MVPKLAVGSPRVLRSANCFQLQRRAEWCRTEGVCRHDWLSTQYSTQTNKNDAYYSMPVFKQERIAAFITTPGALFERRAYDRGLTETQEESHPGIYQRFRPRFAPPPLRSRSPKFDGRGLASFTLMFLPLSSVSLNRRIASATS